MKVAAFTYSGEQPKDDKWCFAMTTDSNCQPVQGSVLIDSGSDEHVCRKEFAPTYETQPDPHPVTLRDVQKEFFNNTEFETYLFRLVHLELPRHSVRSRLQT